MSENGIAGLEIMIAGGDARELILAGELKEKGAIVSFYGFEKAGLPPELLKRPPDSVDVIILPLPGVNMDGLIYSVFAGQPLHFCHLEPWLRPGMLVIAGRMPAPLQQAMETRKIHVACTAELDELAIHNAVPTAEGAVAMAMQESDITIHGSRALVTGFGRCGIPLARTLHALGASVTVAARRREARAMAEALGFAAVTFEMLLEQGIADFDFIFNTVPELILTENVIESVKQGAVIIDIASAPGGTDFAAAEKRKLKCYLAPGLPGKVAPVSAGKILARVYPHIISKHRKGGEQG